VKLLAGLEVNVFPWLGDRPIRDIKPPELLSVLRRVESRGVLAPSIVPRKSSTYSMSL
jgi:hypothetical protein